MDLKEKFGIETRDEAVEAVKASIVKATFKVRVEKVLFYVPFGQLEGFLKMALSAKNNIEIYSCENTDLILV